MTQPHDLRTFLHFVRERSGRHYVQVDRPVSPKWEMAAIVAKLEAGMRMPVIEFANVEGTVWHVVTNVCASMNRVAGSHGVSTAEFEKRLQDSYDRPIAPVPWSGAAIAPVRENVLEGEAVNLLDLPQIRYTEVETSPYLTATAVVARDPVTGVLNVSYHRLMICGRDSTAIYIAPGGHLQQIVDRNAANGDETPVAAFSGCHPTWSLGALAAGSADVDEYQIIGGLLGSPLETTPGIVDPSLPVPARAELVLEGTIDPVTLVEEGPFGEFAGYAMEREERPLFKVSVLSHRNDPLFQDIVAGRLEHLTMAGVTLRAHLQHTVCERTAGILDIHLPAPMTVFLKVDTAALPNGAVPKLIRDLLGESYVKHVYCFDTDIDLTNSSSIQWAIATRVQADRDIVMLTGARGNEMDPSEIDGKTTKWGVDATAKPNLASYARRNTIPREIYDRIDVRAILTDRGTGSRE
ncbi:MAG: UbiD family decarboxylase domain-containing protein [Gemmatimonadales bacterium]